MSTINLDNNNSPVVQLERGKRYSLTKPIRNRSVVAVGDPKQPKPVVTFASSRVNAAPIIWEKSTAKLEAKQFIVEGTPQTQVFAIAGTGHTAEGIEARNCGLAIVQAGSGKVTAALIGCSITGRLQIGGVYGIYATSVDTDAELVIKQCNASVNNDSEAVLRLQGGRHYIEDSRFVSLGSLYGKQVAHLRGFEITAIRSRFVGSIVCGQLYKQGLGTHAIPEWIAKNPDYVKQIHSQNGGNVDARKTANITLRECHVAGYVDAEPGVNLLIDGGEYVNNGEGGGILFRPAGGYLDRPAAAITFKGKPIAVAKSLTNAAQRCVGEELVSLNPVRS